MLNFRSAHTEHSEIRTPYSRAIYVPGWLPNLVKKYIKYNHQNFTTQFLSLPFRVFLPALPRQMVNAHTTCSVKTQIIPRHTFS